MSRAGVGARVITPDLPVALAGFSGRAGPAREVIDDLEVRALWLGSESALCLLIFDLLGMSSSFATPIRAAVAEALDLTVEQVLTSCIHTHAGPNCIDGGEALGWPTPEGYRDMLVKASVDAAAAARSGAEVAELSYTRQPLPAGLSHNRRENPYDPSFAVVDIRSGADRIATLANVGVHPVAIGREIDAVSTDWVGPFRRAVEASCGGRALLLQGALGDVNPAHHPAAHEGVEGSIEHAEETATGIAAAVSDALSKTSALGEDIRVTRHRRIDVPAAGLLAAIAGVGDSLPVELIEWQVGDARLISVPGEAFHALGKAIEATRNDPVLLAGLAPVWQGYLPEPFGDGYEETVSFGGAAVSAIRDALLDPG